MILSLRVELWKTVDRSLRDEFEEHNHPIKKNLDVPEASKDNSIETQREADVELPRETRSKLQKIAS